MLLKELVVFFFFNSILFFSDFTADDVSQRFMDSIIKYQGEHEFLNIFIAHVLISVLQILILNRHLKRHGIPLS